MSPSLDQAKIHEPRGRIRGLPGACTTGQERAWQRTVKPALQGRFLTHVSVVRVNQIEVTPTRSIGEDEAADNSPDMIRSRREAFLSG